MQNQSLRQQAYRRTRRVALGVCLAMMLTAIASYSGASAQDDEFNRGRGRAVANGVKVNPVVGNLSFGITSGLSIAAHQNTGGQGQSAAVDTGVLGVSLAGEGCEGAAPTWPEEDQPQPVTARTGQEGAEQGFQEYEQGLTGGISKFASANSDPFATAITTISSVGDSGVATIEGGEVFASSGVIDGNVRQARAVTEIGRASVLDGAIELLGMRWEAIHRSGAVDEIIHSFTIEGVSIGGTAIPLSGDTDAIETTLSEILQPLGIVIQLPRARVAQGVAFVDPLVVGIAESELLSTFLGDLIGQDGLLGQVFEELRDELTDLIIDLDCGELGKAIRDATDRGIPGESLVSILDIVINSTIGGGSTTLEFGGVTATTAEIDAFVFGLPGQLPQLDDVPPPVPQEAATPPAPPAAAQPPAAPATEAPVTTTTTTQAPLPDEQAIQPIVAASGSRGGWLVLVGAVGLALLMLAAEADRRKMRHALVTASAGGSA